MTISRARVLGLALGCAGAATSCITSPETNTVVDSARQPVQIQGQLPIEYGTSLTVQYLTTSQTWANLGSTVANRAGLWQFSAAIPTNGWNQPCGVAVLRANSNTNQQLVVRDDACVTALPPNAEPEAISACYTPYLYLHQPHVYQGDLNIVGAAQAAPHQCTTKVVGNLTVDNVTDPLVALPSLHDVTGNVDITLRRFVDSSSNPPKYPAGRFDSPILASIGGNVAVHTVRDPSIPGVSFGSTYYFGLDGVTSVGGDIFIENTAFPGHAFVLNALLTHDGNVTIHWDPNDVNATHALSSLREVTGNVTVTVNPNANSMLRALEHIGQDLDISTSAGHWHTNTNAWFFESLTTVDGNLTLHKPETSCTTLVALEYVGGALTFEGSYLYTDGYLGSKNAAPLSVGAFAVIDGDAPIVPAGPDLEVRNDGAVTLTNAPNLCDCSTSEFVMQLEASGWGGTATISGNGATASCMPCPAPATCP